MRTRMLVLGCLVAAMAATGVVGGTAARAEEEAKAPPDPTRGQWDSFLDPLRDFEDNSITGAQKKIEDATKIHLGLGFTEDLLIPGEGDGSIHHCQLDWPEGGRVMLSSAGERSTPCRPGTSSLHVVTADPEAVLARAHTLGATMVHELVTQTDYPSREFTVADPDGNHWTFATFAG